MEVQGTLRCPSCGHANRPDRRFCTQCGGHLGAVCPSCGAPAGSGERFCGACGAALDEAPAAESSRPASAGERRQLTVLFCDLVGSTALSGELDPEDYRAVVRRYQEAAGAVVERHGGRVAQHLGDGLLVYFGWPQTYDDAAERAVRTGLALVDLVRTIDTPAPIAIRVGMHTGAVVVADEKKGAGVFGETPNLAARVQAMAEPGAVMITAATHGLVSGLFVVEDRGAQRLRGVSRPVTLYRVVQPSGVRSRFDVAAGRLTPLVGREIEMATLWERWHRAVEGEGQTVLVSGEAGVGKSRLVYELRLRLAMTPHTWLECRCTPYTAETPFAVVAELVTRGFGFAPEDTAEDQVEKLARGLGRAGFALEEAVPLAASLIGLASPASYPSLQMSPELQRRKTLELLVGWTLALAEVQPLALLVEDLHWCDPSSLELLGHVIEQSPLARLLLVGTARPEFRAPWSSRSNLTSLNVARLTQAKAREMVMSLGGGALPVAMVEVLVARADGVPLYLEELTKPVLAPGAEQRIEAIPATLQDSLMARLDRLATAKDVAQRAAVLGREFSYALLAATVGLDEGALEQGLGRLVDEEILFARGEPPRAVYTFKHALVQEAAYQSLLKRTRQQCHRRVVEVLEARFPDRIQAEPEVAARHAEAAGLSQEALAYYERAGTQAKERSAHAEAIADIRKAIALAGTLPESRERDAREAGLQMALGGSLAVVQGYAQAETGAAYERARELCEATGDTAGLAAALVGLSVFHNNGGQLERAIALAERVLVLGEETGDRSLVLSGHAHAGFPKHWQGRFAASLAHCERALALYDPVHDRAAWYGSDPRFGALGFAASNLWYLGQPDRALARAREGVTLARGLAHPFSLAQALLFETHVHGLRADISAQRERAAEMIALSEAQGFPLLLGFGKALHGAARLAEGDQDAMAQVMEGLALAAETGDQAGAPGLLGLLAVAHAAAGQLPEALGTVETGLAVAAQKGEAFSDAELHRLKGELVLATGGGAADTEALFRRALEIARAQEARSFELRAATSLARLLGDQGRRAEARAELAPVYAWFTEGFDTRDLREAKALLDELT